MKNTAFKSFGVHGVVLCPACMGRMVRAEARKFTDQSWSAFYCRRCKQFCSLKPRGPRKRKGKHK